MTNKIDPDREYISTTEAAARSGYSRVYIAQRLRDGVGPLEGFQLVVGSDWFVYTDSLEKFMQERRKSGPKGPRKKPIQADQPDQK